MKRDSQYAWYVSSEKRVSLVKRSQRSSRCHLFHWRGCRCPQHKLPPTVPPLQFDNPSTSCWNDNWPDRWNEMGKSCREIILSYMVITIETSAEAIIISKKSWLVESAFFNSLICYRVQYFLCIFNFCLELDFDQY